MKKQVMFKFCLLAILSALGVILMIFLEIPYPVAPFLKIEVSDFVVILTFLLFGFKEAVIVTFVKTFGDLLFEGPVGPYGVGQITAFVASLTYCLGMWLVRKLVKKDNIGLQVLGYGLIVLFVTSVMTIANYFVLTPVFLGKFSFLDMTNDSLAAMTGINSYLLAIMFLYIPFNLLKGTLVVLSAATVGMTALGIFEMKMGYQIDQVLLMQEHKEKGDENDNKELH